MVTFTLQTPFTTGSMSDPITIKSLQITGVNWTSTPALAPLGSQQLDIVLTEPTNGWQETVKYLDATVGPWWTALTTANAEALGDIVATAAFNKLIADGKLPAGTISVA